MTITAKLAQAHARLAQVMPHADTLTLPGEFTPGPLDEHDNPTEGTYTPGASLPCHASRIEAKDAVVAGLSGEKEIWRIVVNAPNILKSDSTVSIRLADQREFNLAILSVSGVLRTVALAEKTT